MSLVEDSEPCRTAESISPLRLQSRLGRSEVDSEASKRGDRRYKEEDILKWIDQK